MFDLKKYKRHRLIGKIKLMSTWMVYKGITTAAIDVTSYCNLKCIHCYWWKEEHPNELNDDQMIKFMEHLKDKGLSYAIIFGGEPMLRPKIVEAASEIFILVNSFTNGTLGFLNIPCQWILSLDGPEEIHDKLRGKGVFKKAIGNLNQAIVPPIIHMTITQQNKHCVGELIEIIYKENVKGIGISFYTPSIGKTEENIFVPLEERDKIVKDILKIQKDYPGFLGFTNKIANQYLTYGDFNKWNSRKKCDVFARVKCYGSDGIQKHCTYGNNADCSRCGCAAVTTYRASVLNFDYESIKVMMSLL